MAELNETAKAKGLQEARKRLHSTFDDVAVSAMQGYADALPGTSEPDPGPIQPPPPADDFVIFEDINYRGRPQLGMIPLKIHYESAFFSDKKGQGAYENLPAGQEYPLPALSRVASVARGSPSISCVDIERGWNSWNKNGDEAIDPRAIDWYETICTAYDDALPRGHRFGLYSTLPLRSYWPVISGRMMDWKGTNSAMVRVAELVDVTFPSIYTFYTPTNQDRARWEDYAAAQITEAKRIAPGKPCYPFLWPQFHSGDDAWKGKPVPRDYFRDQLDLCRDLADGVVIWTLSATKNVDFSDIPDWWEAVEGFVEKVRG